MEQEQRCKNCGAPLTLTNHSRTVECDHCGSVFELDDNRAQFVNLYAQADDAWSRKDFDEAIKAYQQIVDEDYAQSEAHWGVAMCRYGIAYELDPIKYVEMPTCNRINRDSILNDKNYLAAIKYAGERAKIIYTQRAQEIDRISKEFLKIVDNEKPYDVFISYKRTDAEGRRTIDSQIAKKLYLFLTEQKINVFFAEETLREIGGERYEPYIFAALNSAKVMVLFGSSKEHINATWVKNEWRRFLILSENDPKKVLIPVFIGRDPYQILPQELLAVQAYDAASPVFHEEITENIKKKMGGKAPAAKGSNLGLLAGRYATEENIEKVLEATDCDPELASEVLIIQQGKVSDAIRYITSSSDYIKSVWTCSECGRKNTHDVCRNPKCGMTKADSATMYRKREEAKREMADRARKEEEQRRKEYERSAAARKARAAKASKAFSSLIAVLIVLGILFGVGYGIYAIYNSWIKPAIYNNSTADSFYTPELVQTYSGTYKNGSAILTFTECSQDGVLQGTFEFITDDAYGQYTVIGTITDKKNNGKTTIQLAPGEWIYQPGNYSMLEEFTIYVDNDYTSITSSANSFNLSAGTDSESSIKTAEDLKKLNGSNRLFKLENDIDLSGIDWDPISDFSGVLMGNGYTIRNLTIDANESNIGFFSTLNGLVKDVNFENASVTVSGRNENIGILCGNLNGNLSNVTVSGTVNAAKCTYVGGMCGLIDLDKESAFSNITNDASVTGLSYIGGIAGKIQYYNHLTLDSLVNSGAITAEEDYAGGIAGMIDRKGWGGDTMEILDCSNTGNISGRYYVGGLGGYVYSTKTESVMRDSSNAAQITGDAYIGGIAGYIYRVSVESAQNSGTTFVVDGSITEDGKRYAYLGGFFGYGYDISISNCTNEASIEYTGGGMHVGGIIGCSEHSGVYKNITNNANISGAEHVGGIAGFLGGDGTTVEDATNTGSITGSNYVGGITGEFLREGWGNSIHMYDSTNSGNIKGNSCVGGLIGEADVNAESSLNNSTNTGSVSGKDKTGKLVGDKGNLTINENG